MPEFTRQERYEIAQRELEPLDDVLRKMGFKFGNIPSREIMGVIPPESKGLQK